MDNASKMLFVALIYLGWGYLVCTGKTPVDPFIQVLREGLIALGAYHAALTVPSGGRL